MSQSRHTESTVASPTLPLNPQKRQSMASSTGPPGPPPSQPPPPPPSQSTSAGAPIHPYAAPSYSNNPLSRPGVTARLAAVSAFNRNALPNHTVTPISMPHSQSQPNSQSISPTTPAETPSDARTPSSRRALTAALELAQQAVKLDSREDPHAAVVAYGKSIVLLYEVMERVMTGDNPSASPRRNSGRRRTVVAKEEEINKLKSILDTYADRMIVLCNLYDIPMDDLPVSIPLKLGSQAPSPPSSSDDQPKTPPETEDTYDAVEGIGSAMVGLGVSGDSIGTSVSDMSMESSSYNHSYQSDRNVTPTAYNTSTQPSSQPVNRASVLPPIRPPPPGPPPAPPSPPTTRPPSRPPPPTPSIVEPPVRYSTSAQSASHSRAGSGSVSNRDDRLDVLREDDHADDLPRSPYPHSRQPSPFATQNPDRDSHPLPPLPDAIPSSSSSATRSRSSSPLPQSTPTPLTPRVSDTHMIVAPKRVSSIAPAAYGMSFGMGIGGSILPPSSARNRPDTGGSASSGASSTRTISDTTTPSVLVSPSTATGSIAQRRHKSALPPTPISSSPVPSRPPSTTPPSAPPSSISPSAQPPVPAPPMRLTASVLPPNTANSLGMSTNNNGGRNRAASQPGRRPSLPGGSHSSPAEFGAIGLGIPGGIGAIGSFSSRSTTPGVPRKASFPSSLPPSRLNPNAGSVSSSPSPTPSHQLPIPQGASLGPLPPNPPVDPLRKPFHLMSVLCVSMTSKQGGYLSRRLFIPHEVWSQGGAKLTNLQEKGKCVEILNTALEDVATGSSEFFRGAGRAGAEKWIKILEEWTNVCDGVVGSVGKKLGVGEGVGGKKSGGVTAWAGKINRSFDKLTNGKNFDSPTLYVFGLAKLFQLAQLFDEHIKALANSLNPTPYSTLPPDLRLQVEARLKRASEFFASVVLTFVIRDLGLLLDKFVRKGEKWLAE